MGRVRERNEDACFAGQHVFAVADGLGGHQAGEVASDLALGSVRALDQTDAQSAAKGIADCDPWLADDEVVPLDLVDQVVGPAGLQAPAAAVKRANCPVAPELLRLGHESS